MSSESLKGLVSRNFPGGLAPRPPHLLVNPLKKGLDQPLVRTRLLDIEVWMYFSAEIYCLCYCSQTKRSSFSNEAKFFQSYFTSGLRKGKFL